MWMPSIPGYGFLSENAGFRRSLRASQIKFIGPRPEVIRMMGVKERARAFMQELGVPILPGSRRRARTRPKKRWNWPARSATR